MNFGNYSFTLFERVKIALGARLFVSVDANKPQFGEVRFRRPLWVGKIVKTTKVPAPPQEDKSND